MHRLAWILFKLPAPIAARQCAFPIDMSLSRAVSLARRRNEHLGIKSADSVWQPCGRASQERLPFILLALTVPCQHVLPARRL